MAEANPRRGRIGHDRHDQHRSTVTPQYAERKLSQIAVRTDQAQAAARGASSTGFRATDTH